jgi:hypothetical protein
MSRIYTPDQKAPTDNTSIWVAGAIGATVIVAGTLWISPWVLAGLAVLAFVIFAWVRIGFPTAGVTGSVVALGAAGFLTRLVPQADILTQAAVFLLILMGLAMLHTIRTTPAVAAGAIAYLVIATGSAMLVAQSSIELAFRGWVGLVGPVLAAAAAAAATRPRPGDDGSKRRKWVLAAVITTTLANIVVGMRQSIVGMDGSEIRSAMENDSTYLVGDQIRLMGTFPSNQDFGAFSACIAPALLVMALRTRGKTRIGLAITSLLCYIVILLSLTRTALIAAVAVGLIGAFAWGRGSIPKRVIKGTLITAGAVGFLAFIISVMDIKRAQDAVLRATSLFNLGGDISYNARLGSTLPRAWGIFADSPLGLGVGSAGPVSSHFYNLAPEGAVTADNGYLTIAIQLGLFGAIAFIVFLIGAAWYLGRSSSPYSIAAAAACLGLMVAMLTAGYWSLLAPVCIVTALIGLGISDNERAKQHLPDTAT